MEVGDDDQFGTRCNVALDFGRIETEAVLEAAVESLQIGTEVECRRFEQFYFRCTDADN